MAFSDFTLDELTDRFGLQQDFDRPFLDRVEPVEVSPLTRDWLERYGAIGQRITSEKGRGEILIAPMLLEACARAGRPVSFFSGTDLTVDAAAGLRGFCDYVLSLSPNQIILTMPLVMLVEAKGENLPSAVPQCFAEMYAAQLLNERRRVVLDAVYGVVTTGMQWGFLRLQGNLMQMDPEILPIEASGKILGNLLEMLKGPLVPSPAVPVLAEVA